MSEAEKYAKELQSEFPYNVKSGQNDYNNLVKFAQETIIESLCNKDKEIIKKIPTIVISAGDVDIFCAQVPENKDEAIVVVGERYFIFMQEMIHLCVWFLENKKKIDNQIISETGYFLSEFFALLYYKRPLDRYPDFLSKKLNSELSLALFFSSICFLLSHEYSHIINGHLNPKNVQSILINDVTKIAKYKKYREFESEADIKGAEIFLNLKLPEVSQIIPFVVLSIISYIDHLTLLIEGSILKQIEMKNNLSSSDDDIENVIGTRESYSTHSLSRVRFNAMLEKIKNKVNPKMLMHGDDFLKFLFDSMYNFDDKSITIIHECGNKLVEDMQKYHVVPSETFLLSMRSIAKKNNKKPNNENFFFRMANLLKNINNKLKYL